MPHKRNQSDDVLYLRGIPKEVKSEFKAACAKRGISMLEAITDFMREFNGKAQRLSRREGSRLPDKV